MFINEFYISFIVDDKQENIGTWVSGGRLRRPWVDTIEGAWMELKNVVEKVARETKIVGDKMQGVE